MVVNPHRRDDLKLCYVLCANRRISCDAGRSPIVYIGTTRNGIDRVAQSDSRQRIRSWHRLKRALLLTFRERYETVSICNTMGKKFVETDEFRLFSRSRVSPVMEDLTRSGAADEVEISD